MKPTNDIPDDAVIGIEEADYQFLAEFTRGERTLDELHERYGNPIRIPARRLT